jgi:fructuronate reductase
MMIWSADHGEPGQNARPGDRLCETNLPSLPRHVGRPQYQRNLVVPGIVHIGVGAFHRAHQAVYLDGCLADEPCWGIVGASLRHAETRDRLAPQDNLYTVAVQEPAGERFRVIGSVLSIIVAPENPSALVMAMAAPTTRIVTLTVTEKAYLRDRSGNLDLAHPDIAHDLAEPAHPRTVHGFIAAALDRRRRAGTPPFAVLCCDNLPANGETLRRLVLQFAQAWDRELARHVEHDVAFPSTMVDRIVPATTLEDRERISAAIGFHDAWPVKTGPFTQWVVEENFPLGRPQWEQHGVTMVADVRPFEEMKLRLLNGAHSAIAYLGLLAGMSTVSEAFGDPRIRSFVDRLWEEAIPTLDLGTGFDLPAYTTALSARFSNAALVHRTAQIAMDGSQKMPQRILATAREQARKGRSAEHLMLVAAAWIACCEARGASLPANHFTDPLDGELERILGKRPSACETVHEVFRRAGFNAVLEEAAQPLAGIAARHLEILRRDGVAAAIAAAAQAGPAT